MKRILFLAVIVSLCSVMLFSCTSMKEKNGVITYLRTDGAGYDNIIKSHEHVQKYRGETVCYNSNDEMINALVSREIKSFTVSESIAKRIAQDNEELTVSDRDIGRVSYAMMTTDREEDAYSMLNGAISMLKTRGVIDELAAKYIGSGLSTNIEMPYFGGEQTLKIGIVGEMSPIDSVSDKGEGVGFNVALLAKIAETLEINIKTVKIDSSERVSALRSGKIDALFCVRIEMNCPLCDDTLDVDAISGMALTESYLTEKNRIVILK